MLSSFFYRGDVNGLRRINCISERFKIALKKEKKRKSEFAAFKLIYLNICEVDLKRDGSVVVIFIAMFRNKFSLWFIICEMRLKLEYFSCFSLKRMHFIECSLIFKMMMWKNSRIIYTVKKHNWKKVIHCKGKK